MIKSEVIAKHNTARISPKKVKPVLDMIRSKALDQAKLILAFDPTKAAKMVLKVVKSAEANAKNNHGKTVKDMFISEAYVNEAQVYKRGRAASRGRPSPILKRNSHIFVGLSEAKKLTKEAK